MDGYRALWSAVVAQAIEDIREERFDSILYNQAVAFFTGPGHWVESRVLIADFLSIHPDDLVRLGQRLIAERREKEGLPPEPVKAVRRAETPSAAAPRPRPVVTPPAPLPRLVATFNPEPVRGRAARAIKPRWTYAPGVGWQLKPAA